MATPYAAEYLEFIGETDTLLIGSRAIWAVDLADFRSIGDSNGDNVAPAGAQGEVDRPATRQGLTAEVGTLVVDGHYDQDNVLLTCEDDWRANAIALSDYVTTFFDVHCIGRLATARLTINGDTREATAKLTRIAPFNEHAGSRNIFTTALQVRVGLGMLVA